MKRSRGCWVERYLAEVLNGADPASAAELIASERLLQSTATFRAAFPDASVTTQLMLERGGLVAVQLSGRGTQLGLFQGLSPHRPDVDRELHRDLPRPQEPDRRGLDQLGLARGDGAARLRPARRDGQRIAATRCHGTHERQEQTP